MAKVFQLTNQIKFYLFNNSSPVLSIKVWRLAFIPFMSVRCVLQWVQFRCSSRGAEQYHGTDVFVSLKLQKGSCKNETRRRRKISFSKVWNILLKVWRDFFWKSVTWYNAKKMCNCNLKKKWLRSKIYGGSCKKYSLTFVQTT